MSAESKTQPGGYSGQDNLKQFDIDDKRSLSEICTLLTEQGIDPMQKDWERVL